MVQIPHPSAFKTLEDTLPPLVNIPDSRPNSKCCLVHDPYHGSCHRPNEICRQAATAPIIAETRRSRHRCCFRARCCRRLPCPRVRQAQCTTVSGAVIVMHKQPPSTTDSVYVLFVKLRYPGSPPDGLGLPLHWAFYGHGWRTGPSLDM